MNLKAIIPAFALAASQILSGCTNGPAHAPEQPSSPSSAPAVKSERSAENFPDPVDDSPQGKNLMRRIETYAQVGSSYDLYSYTPEGDGQFMDLVIDSANRRHVIHTGISEGYNYMMGKLAQKGGDAGSKWQLDRNNVRIINEYAYTSGAPNPNAMLVKITHGTDENAVAVRKNDTQTNLEELKVYSETGSPFTISAGVYKSNLTDEKIPCSVKIMSQSGTSMTVPLDQGMSALTMADKAYGEGIVSIQREEVNNPVSDNYFMYVAKVGKGGQSINKLLHPQN